MTADIFDVYDEYPEVVAVPVAEAVEGFRQHWLSHRNRPSTDFANNTVESRKAAREEWARQTAIVELRLARSIMAEPAVPE